MIPRWRRYSVGVTPVVALKARLNGPSDAKPASIAMLLPKTVLTTFPESRRLTAHRLPPGENRSRAVLIWGKGADSPNIAALRQILSGPNRSKA